MKSIDREDAETRVATVMLVDDHDVVRSGLRSLIDRCDDLVVIAEAATAAEAVKMGREHDPDVVVLDVRLPDRSGIDVCRQLRADRPEVAVLMLTSYGGDQIVFDAIMAGAAGYVLKQIRGNDLVDGIRRVARGESLLDPAVTDRVLDRIRHPSHGADDVLSRLTPTEVRIVELIAEGMTNREIGGELGLAEKTIKNYVSSILSKMHMSRRSEAAAYLASKRARQDAPPWS